MRLQAVADKGVTSMEALGQVRYPFNTVKMDLSKEAQGRHIRPANVCRSP